MGGIMNKCPYCGTKLEKKLTRKKKCAHCKNDIYVRNKKPVTFMEAEFIDYSKRLGFLGITEKLLHLEQKALSKRFGQEASVRDTVWSMLNKSIAKADPQDWRHIYWEMARIARIEGKNPRPYIRQSLEAQLKSHKIQALENPDYGYYVKIENYDDYNSCAKCQELNGKTYSIDEALNLMPIPDICENSEGCRCSYSLESKLFDEMDNW